MIKQLKYFFSDYKRAVGNKSYRWLVAWFSRAIVGIWLYRFERGMYLTFGKGWQVVRIILSPILWLLYAYSNCEINYKANIGPGILILHPSLGIVISGRATVGKNLLLTGGNCIGFQQKQHNEEFLIGDNCSMSANSVIIGPVTLGNNIIVGAGAVVVKSFGDDLTLVGVPAKRVNAVHSSLQIV